MTHPLDLSARDCARLYAQKKLSPVEYAQALLARLDLAEPQVNAFLILDREGLLAGARAAEARWAKGAPLGPADGLVATIKDNIQAQGWPMRRGTRLSPEDPSTEDSPSTQRLREAGALILGKTTMPEIGWKGLGDAPLHGVTRNPWNLARTTGGSSAGAAAAAALGLGHFHMGTDGLGSIRIPAAFCGVFGLKPSFGRVPAHPYSTMSVLAHLGPLTRSVADSAFMLSLIGRPDDRDIYATNTPCPDFTQGLDAGVLRRRIAFVRTLPFACPVDPEIAAGVEAAAKVFTELGAEVREVELPMEDPRAIADTLWQTGAALAMRAMTSAAEAGVDPGLIEEVRKGRAFSGVDYLDAIMARNALSIEMARFMDSFDLVLTPQMPTAAPPIGADFPPNAGYSHWLDWSPFTYPFNITQQPAASVPCGLTADGLPMALQIIGRRGADALVLQAAHAFEQARPFARINAPARAGD